MALTDICKEARYCFGFGSTARSLGPTIPPTKLPASTYSEPLTLPPKVTCIRFGECAEWLIGGSALSRVYQPQTVQMAATSPLGRDANLPTA